MNDRYDIAEYIVQPAKIYFFVSSNLLWYSKSYDNIKTDILSRYGVIAHIL